MMPQMWVELLSRKRITKGGTHRDYLPGERINLSTYHAMQWINEGCAKPLDAHIITAAVPRDGGIVATHNGPVLDPVRNLKYDLVISPDPVPLLWTRTMFWDTSALLRIDILGAAFSWLAWWECVIPLWSYTELAAHVGDEAEREYTRSVVRDLRCLLYDPRVMWLRRCPDGEALLSTFREEKTKGQDERLALLRAIYKVKPIICAAPATWIAR